MANDRLDKIHAEAMELFDESYLATIDERTQSLQDRRFYVVSGAQWEGQLAELYEKRAKFEVNKALAAVTRITNEYRNNRITVDFIGRGESDDELAETLDGLYRADEQDSVADEAYDNAFEEALGGGIGAWRLRAEYEDDEDEDDYNQRIKIEPIYDADMSVFFPSDAMRQDKSDAKWCIVLSRMSRRAFEEEYDEEPVSWQSEKSGYDWAAPDHITIAEYYKIEEVKENSYTYKNAIGKTEKYSDADFEDDPELKDTLLATGSTFVGKKRVSRKRVRKYLLSGTRVLEDCGYIAGKCIPVIIVYGRRWMIEGIERFMGHVRAVKDAQRLKNMQLSKLGEISAVSSAEKPIFLPEQVEGFEQMWADESVVDYSHMLVNAIEDSAGNKLPHGPLEYTRPPQIPPALAALLQITEQDMSEILGNQQAGEQVVSNISGKAVELIQNKLDMQSFIYRSNFAKGMRRCGEVWLGMAKELYTDSTRRKAKVVDKEGISRIVELMTPGIDKESGAVIMKNDVSASKFDVIVDTGPAVSSRRAAAVRAATGIMGMTQDQETVQVLSAFALMNMEGEGTADMRSYARKKLLRLGVVKPTPEEIEEMAREAEANSQPDANAAYMEAAAQEALSAAQRNESTTVLNLAKADETKAKTIKTLSDVSAAEQEQALALLEAYQKSLPAPEQQQPEQNFVVIDPSAPVQPF